MKYLVTDVETGGFEGTSLLSAYFGVYDKEFNLLDELELFVRPENHQYVVTAEALAINKIDLIEHEKYAIPYKDAGTILYHFLEKNSVSYKYFVPEGSNINSVVPLTCSEVEVTIDKLCPLGHNVTFDILRIKEDLISEGSWLKYVSYRVRDTGVYGNILKDKGLIPETISGSLGSYATNFGIDATGAHDAKKDCEITVAVYKEMLKL